MASLFYQKGIYQPIVINFNRIDGTSPTVTDVKCKVETYTYDGNYFTVFALGNMTNRGGTNVWVRSWRPRPSLKSGVYFITYTYTIDGTSSTYVETITLGNFGGGGVVSGVPNDYLRFDDKRLDVLDKVVTKDYLDEKLSEFDRFGEVIGLIRGLNEKLSSEDFGKVDLDFLRNEFAVFFNTLNNSVVENRNVLLRVLAFCDEIMESTAAVKTEVVGSIGDFRDFSVSKFEKGVKRSLKEISVLKDKLDGLEISLVERNSKFGNETSESIDSLKKLVKENEDKLSLVKNEIGEFFEYGNKDLVSKIDNLKKEFVSEISELGDSMKEVKDDLNNKSEEDVRKFEELSGDLTSFSDRVVSELDERSKSSEECLKSINDFIGELSDSFSRKFDELVKSNDRQQKVISDSFSKVSNKRDLAYSTTQIRDRLNRIKDGFDNKIKFLRSNIREFSGESKESLGSFNEQLNKLNDDFNRIRSSNELKELEDLMDEDS